MLSVGTVEKRILGTEQIITAICFAKRFFFFLIYLCHITTVSKPEITETRVKIKEYIIRIRLNILPHHEKLKHIVTGNNSCGEGE